MNMDKTTKRMILANRAFIFWGIFWVILEKISKLIKEKFDQFQSLSPSKEINHVKNLIFATSWRFNTKQTISAQEIPGEPYDFINRHIEIVKNFIEIIMEQEKILDGISCFKNSFKIVC